MVIPRGSQPIDLHRSLIPLTPLEHLGGFLVVVNIIRHELEQQKMMAAAATIPPTPELANPNRANNIDIIDISDEEETPASSYEINGIIGEKKIRRRTYYLCDWAGDCKVTSFFLVSCS